MSKEIIYHLCKPNISHSACGLLYPKHFTYDPISVTCANCKSTILYKQYIKSPENIIKMTKETFIKNYSNVHVPYFEEDLNAVIKDEIVKHEIKRALILQNKIDKK